MKVFISWSGAMGRAVAETLHAWLPQVLQAVKPFFSANDIAKGSYWSMEIAAELESSVVGLVAVTRESLNAPWIMFEAGALSRNVGHAKVVPLLLDVSADELIGPLAQFQCAAINSVDMKRVLRMLNSELREFAITEDVLESAFAVWWPHMQAAIKEIKEAYTVGAINSVSDRELLDEILGLTKSIMRRQAVPLLPLLLHEVAVAESGALPINTVRQRLQEGGNLVGANLMYLDLSGWDFTGADLRGANLVRADLSGAVLVGANFDAANLEGANLDGVDVRGAQLSRVNFWRASMQELRHFADVGSLDLANLFEVRMSDADRAAANRHRTLAIGTYQALFEYFLAEGMTKSDLQDQFLWTAHSYPGLAL